GKKDYERAVKDYEDALALKAEDASTLNRLAWLRATCADGKYRDGAKAVELARKACELGKWKDVNLLDTLAAACAEAGQFDEAVQWQEKALADPDFEKRAGEEARKRLQLYKDKKSFQAE